MLNMAHHLLVIRIPAEISAEAGGGSASYKSELRNINNSLEQPYGVSKALSRDSHGIHTSTTHSVTGKHLDVEELEMLLEAYFVQIDGTLNKLSTVWNYIYKLSIVSLSHFASLYLHPAIHRLTLDMMYAFQIVDRLAPKPYPNTSIASEL